MNQRNTKRSLDELARQLRVPNINLPEDRLDSLVKAGERIREIMEYVEFMDRHSMSLYIDDGNGPRLMTREEVHGTILDFVGVSKADAETAANYVVNVVRMLQSRGE